jgi:hypothetical protein
VNDLALDLIVHRLEVRYLQRPHRFNRHREALIGAAAGLGRSQPFSCRPQNAKHLRPIESLTFTVITEAHVVPRLRQKVRFIESRRKHSTFDWKPGPERSTIVGRRLTGDT